jgi:uncharacterized protein YdeI (YjbR/CyaY-like superfamily)
VEHRGAARHFRRMKRPHHPIPDDVAAALARQRLTRAYDARPEYQRNDYIGWIGRAKRDDTRLKRITQMLDELAAGGVYMGMDHAPSRKAAAKARSGGR